MASRLQDIVGGGAITALNTALDPHQEYADYVLRFSERYPDKAPLSFSEFEGILARWRQEYHAAWCKGDVATMRALEELLALSDA
jgi:hypothetical protein